MLETSKLIKSPFPNGVPKYYSEMSSAIYNAVNKMALGQLTPEQAFDEMNAKITKLAK
jgi:multiple sugar transport system substrate-binding protein